MLSLEAKCAATRCLDAFLSNIDTIPGLGIFELLVDGLNQQALIVLSEDAEALHSEVGTGGISC